MRGKWIALILIYAMAVTVRIYPLFITPIPFNVDALTDFRAAQFIASHGSLNFPQGVTYNNYHTPITPLFNTVCGAFSQLIGIKVITLIPIIFPFITSFSIVGWYLLTKKITGKEEIGVITATIFAISGTYVLQTSLIWKEAIGFTIMPFILYTYRNKNAVSLFLLLILPLTHHYVALITYLILSFSEILKLYEKYREHIILSKLDYLWMFSLPILWAYMALYYSIRHFDRFNQLSPQSGLWLFLSIFVLFLLAGTKIINRGYKKPRKWHMAIIIIVPLSFYIPYFFLPVFSHTMKFNLITFTFTIGYIILIPIIALGLYLMSTTKYKERSLFTSLLLAPLQMILFFILHGFDPVTYASVSRTYDFLDPGVYTSLAVGSFTSKKKLISFFLVFIILATTTPLAYHTTEAFGVTYFIYPDEIHAAKWIKEHFPNQTISTDNKLGLVARNEFDINGSQQLPLKLNSGIYISQRVWLVGSYWNNGAQMSPMAPIKVNVTKILEQNSVLFSSGRTFVVLNSTS